VLGMSRQGALDKSVL